MKTTVRGGLLAAFFVCGCVPHLRAQDLLGVGLDSALSGSQDGVSLPTDASATRIAPAGVPEQSAAILCQTQDSELGLAGRVETVAGKPSVQADGETPAGLAVRQLSQPMAMALAMVAAGYGDKSLVPEASLDRKSDCFALALRVGQRIKDDRAKLLEIVEAEARANESCACEVVKAAIEASEANEETVATIVETVAVAVPEAMRIAAQCAVAVSPQSLAKVQAVMARLDPNTGDGGASAKSAKSSKKPIEKAPTANPLDLPPYFPPYFPPYIPPTTDPSGYDKPCPPPVWEK